MRSSRHITWSGPGHTSGYLSRRDDTYVDWPASMLGFFQVPFLETIDKDLSMLDLLLILMSEPRSSWLKSQYYKRSSALSFGVSKLEKQGEIDFSVFRKAMAFNHEYFSEDKGCRHISHSTERPTWYGSLSLPLPDSFQKRCFMKRLPSRKTSCFSQRGGHRCHVFPCQASSSTESTSFDWLPICSLCGLDMTRCLSCRALGGEGPRFHSSTLGLKS